MFQVFRGYNKGHDDQNKVENIATRCGNCGKETGLSMDNMNTIYKNIITSFVLNKLLQHIGMSWIIKTNKNLEYYMDKNNSNWTTCGTCYNTSICKKKRKSV